jgi:hypothetical protein
MEQSPVHGADQQERLLCWFGGIIDGEGCITINHNRLHLQTRKETLLFYPLIAITNTDKTIIDTCLEVLKNANLPFYVQFQSVEKANSWRSSNGRNRKARWSIKIQGLKRVVRALNVLSPYIISKKTEANLVKEFCDRRLNAGRVKLKYGNLGCPHYDDRDLEIVEQVAAIHNRNPQRLHDELREYKSRNKIQSEHPGTPGEATEMIVRPQGS